MGLLLIQCACLPQKLAFLAVEHPLIRLEDPIKPLPNLNAHNHVSEKPFNVLAINSLCNPSLPRTTLSTTSKVPSQ